MRTQLKKLLALVCTTPFLMGWDTMVTKPLDPSIDDPLAWQSIYQIGDPQSLPEHSSVSDWTLKSLDPSHDLWRLFGREGTASVIAVDLNASHFRSELHLDSGEANHMYGDIANTKVEERLIPPPALFAGLPDYSYGMYDWINKNKTCPSFQEEEYTSRCHEFFGWLGALNSVHFGTQAQNMYAHYHRNALALAEKTAKLRASMSEAEREAHRSMLLEAELEALAYEGYAQHFLQDRWAIGHMWERWGSPDTEQIKKELGEHIIIGALAGTIHGAEAVVKEYKVAGGVLMQADPLSSPLPGSVFDTSEKSTAIPMEYIHVERAESPVPGIGDERFQDALDRNFSLSKYDALRSDQILNVHTQLNSFLRCAGAGWAETIRALGPTEKPNTYGAFEAPLSARAPNFAIIDEASCWDMWATNESMVTGLLGESPALRIKELGQTALIVDGLVATNPLMNIVDYSTSTGSRVGLVSKATRMWLYAQANEDRTEIAQGKMKSFGSSISGWFGYESPSDMSDMWGFKQGGHYKMPDYVEPIGLVTKMDQGETKAGVSILPWKDVRGRDIQTLYGIFNQAHADYWCEDRETLKDVRALGTRRGQEICRRLADMAYQGTHPSYQGVMKKTRQHAGTDVQSVCALHDKGVESRDEEIPENPFWLDQGYTPYEAANDTKYQFTSFEEVANWCGRVPVIWLSEDEDERNNNIVKEVLPDDETVSLAGRDFGSSKGTVTATSPNGDVIELQDIISWSDYNIILGISGIEWDKNTRYKLKVTLPEQPGRSLLETVGLFYLKVGDEVSTRKKPQALLNLGGQGPCGDPIPNFNFIDISNSVSFDSIENEIANILMIYRKDRQRITPYLEKQLKCMKDLREERLPIIRDFFDNYPEKIQYVENGLRSRAHEVPKFPEVITHPEKFKHERIWAADVYTPYIESLEGTIQFLGKSEQLLEAWDIAYKSDDKLLTAMPNSIALGTLIATAEDTNKLLESAFIDLEKDPTFSKLMSSARARSRMKSRRSELAYVDISMMGYEINAILKNLSVGLSAWTQLQHTLTQIAMPQTTQEIARAQAELKISFHETLSDMEGESIPEIISSDFSDGQFSIVGFWTVSLYYSIGIGENLVNENLVYFFPGPTRILMDHETYKWIDGNTALEGRSAIEQFIYIDQAGRKRGFIDWPEKDTIEVANNWPMNYDPSYFE